MLAHDSRPDTQHKLPVPYLTIDLQISCTYTLQVKVLVADERTPAQAGLLIDGVNRTWTKCPWQSHDRLQAAVVHLWKGMLCMLSMRGTSMWLHNNNPLQGLMASAQRQAACVTCRNHLEDHFMTYLSSCLQCTVPAAASKFESSWVMTVSSASQLIS